MKSDGISRKAQADAAPKNADKGGKHPSSEKGDPKPRESKDRGRDNVNDKPSKEKSKETRREATGQESANRDGRAQGGQRQRNTESAAKPQHETSKAPSAGKSPPVEKHAKPKAEKADSSKPEKSHSKEMASDAAKAHSSAGGRCENKVRQVLISSKSKDGLPTQKEMKEIADTCSEALGKDSKVEVTAEAKGHRSPQERAKNKTTQAEVRVKVVNDVTKEALYVEGARDAYSGDVKTRGVYVNSRENHIQAFENGRPTFEGRSPKGEEFRAFSGGGIPTDAPLGKPSGALEYNVEHKTIYFNPGHGGLQPSTPSDRGNIQPKGRTPESELPSTPAGAGDRGGPVSEPSRNNPKSPRERPEREPPYGQKAKDNPIKSLLDAVGKLTTAGEHAEAASAKLAGVNVLQRAPHLQRARIYGISRSTSLDEALKVVSGTSKSGKAMNAFANSSKRFGLAGTAITVTGIGLDVLVAPAGQGAKVAVSKVSSAVVSGLITAGAGAAAVLSLPITASATVTVLAFGGASVATSFAYDAFAAGQVESGTAWLYDLVDRDVELTPVQLETD